MGVLMTMQWQTAHIPLAQGVDLKADPRALEAPRLSKCENAVFDEIGGIQKRNGHTSLGVTDLAAASIARLRAVATREDELVMFAAGKTWSWVAKESQWVDRERYESCLVTQKTVEHSRLDQVMGDRAEAGNVIVRAWQEGTSIAYACTDKATGARMSLNTITSAWHPKCRAVNGKLHVYYRKSTTLLVDVIDPADVNGTTGSPVTLKSDLTGSAASSPYDVVVSGTTATIAYVNDVSPNPKATVFTIDSAGTIGTTNATGRTATYVAIDYNATSGFWTLVRVTSGTNDVITLDWLTTVTNVPIQDNGTNINITVATETTTLVPNATVISRATQDAWVFWTLRGSTTPNYDVIKKSAVGITNAGTARVLVRHTSLGSRAVLWMEGTTEAALLLHGIHDIATSVETNSQQPCYVLLNGAYSAELTEVGLLARLLPGEGGGAGTSGALPTNGHLPQIESLGSGVFTSALIYKRILAATQYRYSERGIREFTYTFGDARAYRGVQEGRALYLPGGYVAQYDGVRTVESGFLIYPEGVTHAGAVDTGGRLIGGGGVGTWVYQYRFYWEWRNAAGEIERSTYAGNVSVNTAAMSVVANNSVVFTIPTLPYTNKSNVYLAVYRTEVNGTVFYRISPVDPTNAGFVKNNVNADTVTFTDDDTNIDLLDVYLIKRELDPLNAGVLDPVAPPCTTIIAGGQGRLFTIDPEDPTLVRHSMLRIAGDAVMFNDAQTIQTPTDGGDVTTIDVSDNAVVIFKERAIYVCNGQGPDNFGVPLYPAPQKVAEIGCSNARSVVRTSVGVVFKSAKGIYLLDQGYGLKYIGASVEDHNSLTIGCALHLPDKHRVHFICSATAQLVFDYLIGEWCTWTGTEVIGTSGTIWQDVAVHLATAGPYKQDTTKWNDPTAYSFTVETGWLKLDGLQGFYRARAVEVLGEYRAIHAMQVKIANDYLDTWVDTFTWDATPQTVGGPERLKVHPSVQKVEAIKVHISDLAFVGPPAQDSYGETFKLTGLSLEWAPKTGMGRIPHAQVK